MASADRVFIVTDGEYSDYRIVSVWTTREDALAQIGEESTHGPRVEEWVLNERTPTPILQWSAFYNEHTADEIRVGDKADETQEVQTTEVSVRHRVPGDRSKGYIYQGWGYGPSPEHARKSLADALAKAKAEHNDL